MDKKTMDQALRAIQRVEGGVPKKVYRCPDSDVRLFTRALDDACIEAVRIREQEIMDGNLVPAPWIIRR